ncbi:hypothetical protein MTR67_002593 [Solanum verrucosum]|uniref:Reverse transcriptase/retrotransposon-derived protein RNase H-like domain-containing protein n=1 Tax=Solanum verrucosum TaxID=315347 RepID=A0AAF0PQD5_SOLVR|nr:hypothetical protein MTR67_002593 [Solanum verrucosum]
MFVIVFIDYILNYSRSEDDHINYLRIVLQILKDQQLFSKYSKCEFWLKSVAFLGHIVSSKGIEVDPKKTDLVKSWPRPLSLSDIKSLLGLVGYYRRLTSAPVLTILEGTDGFVVYYDASRIRLGCVLKQNREVIVDASKQLKIHEKNYPTQVLVASMHPVFHVSMLKKCVGNPTSIVPLEDLGVCENLSYEGASIEILDRQVEKLRNTEVVSKKVLWRNQIIEDSAWETKANMMSCYPHLFPSTATLS